MAIAHTTLDACMIFGVQSKMVNHTKLAPLSKEWIVKVLRSQNKTKTLMKTRSWIICRSVRTETSLPACNQLTRDVERGFVGTACNETLQRMNLMIFCCWKMTKTAVVGVLDAKYYEGTAILKRFNVKTPDHMYDLKNISITLFCCIPFRTL